MRYIILPDYDLWRYQNGIIGRYTLTGYDVVHVDRFDDEGNAYGVHHTHLPIEDDYIPAKFLAVLKTYLT